MPSLGRLHPLHPLCSIGDKSLVGFSSRPCLVQGFCQRFGVAPGLRSTRAKILDAACCILEYPLLFRCSTLSLDGGRQPLVQPRQCRRVLASFVLASRSEEPKVSCVDSLLKREYPAARTGHLHVKGRSNIGHKVS